MRKAALTVVGCALLFTGCARQPERPRAQEQQRRERTTEAADDPVARKAGRAAYGVAQESGKVAKKAGKELWKAGKEMREGWKEASRERKQRER